MVNRWSPADVPASRDGKSGWYKLHNKYSAAAFNTTCDTIIIGDSIASGLTRYKNVWKKSFSNALNFGIGGDMIRA